MSDFSLPEPQLVPCVSFILLRDGCVLLEKRRADKPVDPGLVMVPGGHIEDGESQQQALIREVREELGVEVSAAHYVASLLHPTTEVQLLHYWLVSEWAGDICAYEADEVFWQPLTELHQFILTPDDIALREAQRLFPQLADTRPR